MAVKTKTHSDPHFREAVGPLIVAIRELAEAGYTPATSGNFSVRLDASHAIITRSGGDKGKVTEDSFIVVDLDGVPLTADAVPSAETELHMRLYRRDREIGCVLHTHSPIQTVASKLYAADGHVRIEGFELLKAFRGNATHEAAVDVPVLANSQDMAVLADAADKALDFQPGLHGYLIEGHGVYAWGRGLREARRHLDALEYLLGCVLDLRRFTR